MYGEGDIEKLYENVPRKLLPAEYGGEAGTIEQILEPWITKMYDYEEYFKDEVNYGTDEKKRPGKPKDEESIFGISGSFKKLDID